MAEQTETAPEAPRHTLFEDVQGIVFGTAMMAVGLGLLQHLGLVTGQTAGLSLLISKWTGLGFGPVFFVINLPFYWFGFVRMGRRFTIKTFAAVGLMSFFSMVQPHVLNFEGVNPYAGAVIAGMILAAGLLAVFRHGASMGGFGILALFFQDRFGFRAGWFQMAVDAMVFALAAITISPFTLLLSVIGAAVMNAIIGINHRRDRYVAM